ncbi:hypothetical protein SARC_03491 [Sphaeroforma arctica JP610]|uniref:Uncharacterized protein n=1 Tax=Sphaeroforma arctica JP610 TaxID=667725 RepID=A0A0L0G5I3_9EUKA|nr:hypothetical protein SARC_03491 [Sphaeroforma arctica JP610]KNC84290.1 hypothetical protein SARC_03491 [Sphaeroforma arctica JP610]|eukprot:XP_014158192.1 hypothetical protein SARC_03491 [Sphaeroforma arctica JP610]
MRQNEFRAYAAVKTNDVIRIRRSSSGLTSTLLAKLDKGNEQLKEPSTQHDFNYTSHVNSKLEDRQAHDDCELVSPTFTFEASKVPAAQVSNTHKKYIFKRAHAPERGLSSLVTPQKSAAWPDESEESSQRAIILRGRSRANSLDILDSFPRENSNLENGDNVGTTMVKNRKIIIGMERTLCTYGESASSTGRRPLHRRASESCMSRSAKKANGLDPTIEDYYLRVDSPGDEKYEVQRQPFTMSQYVQQHTNETCSDASMFSAGNSADDQFDTTTQTYSTSQIQKCNSHPFLGQSRSRKPLMRHGQEKFVNDHQSSQTSFVPMTIHSPTAGRSWPVQPRMPTSTEPRKTLLRRASTYCTRRNNNKGSLGYGGDEPTDMYNSVSGMYQNTSFAANTKENGHQRNTLRRRASDTTALRAKTARMRLAVSPSTGQSCQNPSDEARSLDTVDKRWEDLPVRPFGNGGSNQLCKRRASESDKRLDDSMEGFLPKSMNMLKRFARRASSTSSLKQASIKTFVSAKGLMRMTSKAEHNCSIVPNQTGEMEDDTPADVPSMIFMPTPEEDDEVIARETDVRRLRRRLSERNIRRHSLRVDNARAKIQLRTEEEKGGTSELAGKSDEIAPELICVHVADEKSGGRTTKKVYYQRARTPDFERFEDGGAPAVAVELERTVETDDAGVVRKSIDDARHQHVCSRSKSCEGVLNQSFVLDGDSGEIKSASAIIHKGRIQRRQMLNSQTSHGTRMPQHSDRNEEKFLARKSEFKYFD